MHTAENAKSTLKTFAADSNCEVVVVYVAEALERGITAPRLYVVDNY
jgi:hypothetical protein